MKSKFSIFLVHICEYLFQFFQDFFGFFLLAVLLLDHHQKPSSSSLDNASPLFLSIYLTRSFVMTSPFLLPNTLTILLMSELSMSSIFMAFNLASETFCPGIHLHLHVSQNFVRLHRILLKAPW